jgi:hypothetical protein
MILTLIQNLHFDHLINPILLFGWNIPRSISFVALINQLNEASNGLKRYCLET